MQVMAPSLADCCGFDSSYQFWFGVQTNRIDGNEEPTAIGHHARPLNGRRYHPVVDLWWCPLKIWENQIGWAYRHPFICIKNLFCAGRRSGAESGWGLGWDGREFRSIAPGPQRVLSSIWRRRLLVQLLWTASPVMASVGCRCIVELPMSLWISIAVVTSVYEVIEPTTDHSWYPWQDIPTD